ncbi:subclass B3 metallo-beta-lactamase [uncultured Sphingomonas sp.]|uniref:subclass B3 metallo-beta-lactamase n=1 Tax=uncultured Sphingomonas sp. TaxID=158754 RepID=UPI0035CBD53B
MAERDGRARRLARALIAAAALVVVGAAPLAEPPDWTRPTPAFRIVGPIWYVGSLGIGAYLIRTPRGAILIDGTMAQNVAGVERNIAATGTALRDVRYLLVSHAHFDHVGADAALVRDTGAQVVAGARDRAAIESGDPPGETLYAPVRFAPVHVARAVGEGDVVALGGVTLVAHASPGHTPGCTTWSMRVADRQVAEGRMLDVVFPCSVTHGFNRLVGNKAYPGIVADYRATFASMARLPADVVLPMHPEVADVMGRRDRAARGERDAFVDRGLLRRVVVDAQKAFDAQLGAQAQAADSRRR